MTPLKPNKGKLDWGTVTDDWATWLGDKEKKSKFIVAIKKLGRNKLDPASKLYSQIYHQGYNTGYQVGERKVCKSLLHQRDNEIKRWARKHRATGDWGDWSGEGDKIYIDDLLTYLSNKEDNPVGSAGGRLGDMYPELANTLGRIKKRITSNNDGV